MLRPTLVALLLLSLPVAAEPLNYNIVEFSESAGMEVQHDSMTAHFQVHAEGKDRASTNAAFTQKLNSFSRRLKNSAFKAELLNRNASPRYQYTNSKRIQTGWEETADFKVESKDFTALNHLITESQNEANVENTSFSVSKQKREEVIDEVSKAAILRFKDRAKTLASTLGFSSYKIVKLNLGRIGSRTINGNEMVSMKMYRAAPLSASMNSDENIETSTPGSEEISITVDGSIQM